MAVVDIRAADTSGQVALSDMSGTLSVAFAESVRREWE